MRTLKFNVVMWGVIFLVLKACDVLLLDWDTMPVVIQGLSGAVMGLVGFAVAWKIIPPGVYK